MVRRQLEARGIRDPRVLDAMGRVPREMFVPADLAREAYIDAPLPIGHGQTISQPYIVALMAEAAGLAPGPVGRPAARPRDASRRPRGPRRGAIRPPPRRPLIPRMSEGRGRMGG